MSILKLIHEKLSQGQSPQEIWNYYSKNISQDNLKFNALIETYSFPAEKISLPYESLLAGAPVSYKDNIAVKNKRLTCASRMLEHYISPFNATVVDRLETAKALTIGKSNLDEFAMGSSTSSGIYGAVFNPYDERYGTGGSSGGAAVSVAANFSAIALGSDTGGSIRNPAHFTGVVGVKPSYGTISRYGLVSYGSSLDQIGVLAHFVEDAAYALDIISGEDSNDLTTVNLPEQFFTRLFNKTLPQLCIGVSKSLFTKLDPIYATAINNVLELLKDWGCKLQDIELPDPTEMCRTYQIIAFSEAYSNLARFDGLRYGGVNLNMKELSLEAFYQQTRSSGFGTGVQNRIILGQYCLLPENYDSHFLQAKKHRRYLKNYFNELYRTVDCIISPTMEYTAPYIDPQDFTSDKFTVAANLVGMPAISVPIPLTHGIWPFSVQLMANNFNDGLLLNVAKYIQQHCSIAAAHKAVEELREW